MPRLSPEARAAAHYRAGSRPPQPPKHLAPAAAKLWREVTASRPPEFFRPGATTLLAQFCELSVLQQGYLAMLREDPHNPELQRTVCTMQAPINSLATKLRLAISAAIADNRSGILNEKGDPADQPMGRTRRSKSDVLFGGNVVRF
jgi:hypothetical protein